MAHTIKLGSPEPTRSQRGCAAQSNRCRRLLILVSVVSVALAVGLAVSLAIFAVRRPSNRQPSAGRGPTEAAITRACGVTRYPALCANELTNVGTGPPTHSVPATHPRPSGRDIRARTHSSGS